MECTVTNCPHPIRARGLCEKHYSRLRRHGSVDVTFKPRTASPAEQFRHYLPGDPPPAPSPTEGCWLWPGTIADTGYGTFAVSGVRYGVHRISYELFVGPIPAGLLVLHSCDVRACVQPAHLSAGTQAENLAGMVARGRSLVGESNPGMRLSSVKVAELRARYAAGGVTQRALGAEYGIKQAQVSRIVSGKQRLKG